MVAPSPAPSQLFPGVTIEADGSLRYTGGGVASVGYVNWDAAERGAVLDGIFTPEALRKLAEHMERHMKGRGQAG